jgi:cAMP-dependent protein kinase regulator
MAERSLKQLRRRASLSMRNGDLDEALAAYRDLETAEPANPVWSQRCAEIHHQQGRHAEAIATLEHAAEMVVDAGEIIPAIAICKQILAIDPDHHATLDRIQHLYSAPTTAAAAEPEETAAVELEAPSDAPLDEVLLTEVIPGAVRDISSNPEESGIAEIPLGDFMRDHRRQELTPPERAGTAQEQLLNTPLFGSLDPPSLRYLIAHVRLVSLAEGEALFRQGDPAGSLYVVAEGAVVPIAEEGARKKLAVLEAGSFFGEIGLMTNTPRNSTIEAIVDSRLLEIDRATMWKLIRKRPEVLKVMVCFLRDRLVDRLIRTSPLFLAFPARQRPAVAKLFRFLEVRRGTPLINQDQAAENLFALLAGSAQVIQMGIDSDKVLADLGSGEIFGEMSLLNQSPAMAAVVTSSKCWVLALSHKRLSQLIERNPEAEEIIKNLASDREAENTQHATSPGLGPMSPASSK